MFRQVVHRFKHYVPSVDKGEALYTAAVCGFTATGTTIGLGLGVKEAMDEIPRYRQFTSYDRSRMSQTISTYTIQGCGAGLCIGFASPGLLLLAGLMMPVAGVIAAGTYVYAAHRNAPKTTEERTKIDLSVMS